MAKTTKTQSLLPAKRPENALDALASRLQTDRTKLWSVLKNTAFRGANDEELIGLIIVANQYGLNPLTKEIYAFPAKKGGIVPVVSIDGWARIINDHPQYDNCEFETVINSDGMPVEITCIMYRKDRSHPCKVTEYFKECKRPTDVWNQMPFRMLRHKALIQCARYSFGFGGIFDEDEARDILKMQVVQGQSMPLPEIPPAADIPEFPTSPEPPKREEPEDQIPGAEVPDKQVAEEEPPPLGEVVGGDEAPPPKREFQLTPPSVAPAAGRASYNTVIQLCKKEGISTIELMAWAKEVGVAGEDAKFLSSLTEKQLGAIIKEWPNVGKQIAVMRGGANE